MLIARRALETITRPPGPDPSRERPGGRGFCRAFTLVELMMTLAVMVLVAAIAAPRFGLAGSRYRADSVARRIGADLEHARLAALADSSTRRVRFGVVQNRYTLQGVASLDRRSADTIVLLGSSPYFATLASADFAGGAQIDFSGLGKPSAGGSVIVSVGDERRRIRVDSETGAVSIDRVRRSPDGQSWVYDVLANLSPFAPSSVGGTITGVVGGGAVR